MVLYIIIFNNYNKTLYMFHKDNKLENIEIAVFGAGCFWCVEAIFNELKGVLKVTSGYTGGKTINPTYKQVCTGTTNHTEVVRIEYDSNIISFDELLEVFWKTHDPTTLNRQGADIGTQYRSAIYFTSNKQKNTANYYKTKLNKSNIWQNPIVTEISELNVFYIAENYHNNYYKNNPNEGYCKIVIQPKIEKFKNIFRNKIKQ